MQRYAAAVEYDGGSFAGWQIQNGPRTIEGELARALSAVADHRIELVCAGRTDAGVHATGQIVHFESNARRSARAWTLGANTCLPREISVLWVGTVPAHFHARFSALSRSYRYLLCNRPARPALWRGRAAWVQAPLDVAAMNAAAAQLLGEHDFSAFRAAECQSRSTVRRLDRLEVHAVAMPGAAETAAGALLEVTAQANAFLHHMVRNLVGLLIAVGRGAVPPAHATAVLQGRDRRRAPPTAPAEGLYLHSVEYPAGFGLPEPWVTAAATGSAIMRRLPSQG
jgi:tRNA pseudouridine38-40 synthase